MSDLVGNPLDQISHIMAHILTADIQSIFSYLGQLGCQFTMFSSAHLESVVANRGLVVEHSIPE